jgi:hypothetical protein
LPDAKRETANSSLKISINSAGTSVAAFARTAAPGLILLVFPVRHQHLDPAKRLRKRSMQGRIVWTKVCRNLFAATSKASRKSR